MTPLAGFTTFIAPAYRGTKAGYAIPTDAMPTKRSEQSQESELLPEQDEAIEPKDGDAKVGDREPSSPMRHAGMGFELAAAILGFTAFGYWVDRSLNSFPRGTATGAVLGIIGGMYNFLRDALKLAKEQEAEYRSRKNKDASVAKEHQPDERNRRP